MDWIARLNEAIDHIEAHLQDGISCEELGRICCCSAYQFQRMFGYLADISLSEYIRRRKMSLAAVDLQAGEKIIDIALKYGYSSPTAFNRAFQSVHGVAPSQVRKIGVLLRSYPPLRFKITVKGVEEMNYRIEKREAFRVVGVSCPLEQELEKNLVNVPKLWQKAGADGSLARLAEMINGEPGGILGIYAYGPETNRRCYLAVATDRDSDGMEEYTVPACTWAIFPGQWNTPEDIQRLEQRIAAEWLPSSGYEYAAGPDIEVYLEPAHEGSAFEVWIPVVKK